MECADLGKVKAVLAEQELPPEKAAPLYAQAMKWTQEILGDTDKSE